MAYYQDMNEAGTLRGELKISRPTPKLHILAAHVPEFINEHSWWGLLSEQGVEHLHSVYNKLVSSFKSKKSKKFRPSNIRTPEIRAQRPTKWWSTRPCSTHCMTEGSQESIQLEEWPELMKKLQEDGEKQLEHFTLIFHHNFHNFCPFFQFISLF